MYLFFSPLFLTFSGLKVEQVETHQTDGKDPFCPKMHLHLNDTVG